MLLDQTWFCRYPHPSRCISDSGSEFLGKEYQELFQSHGVNSLKQPSSYVIKRVHQTLGNMLRSCKLEDYDFDHQDPWLQVLANCA
jgi:hypothetical protein